MRSLFESGFIEHATKHNRLIEHVTEHDPLPTAQLSGNASLFADAEVLVTLDDDAIAILKVRESGRAGGRAGGLRETNVV